MVEVTNHQGRGHMEAEHYNNALTAETGRRGGKAPRSAGHLPGTLLKPAGTRAKPRKYENAPRRSLTLLNRP